MPRCSSRHPWPPRHRTLSAWSPAWTPREPLEEQASQPPPRPRPGRHRDRPPWKRHGPGAVRSIPARPPGGRPGRWRNADRWSDGSRPARGATSAIRTLTPLRSMHRRAACHESAVSLRRHPPAVGQPSLGRFWLHYGLTRRRTLHSVHPVKSLFSTGHSPPRDEGHVSKLRPPPPRALRPDRWRG